MLDDRTKKDIVELLKDFKDCCVCRESFEPTDKNKGEYEWDGWDFNASQHMCPDCISCLFTRDAGDDIHFLKGGATKT